MLSFSLGIRPRGPLAVLCLGAHADDIEIGTVKYLADTLGLKQVGYRDWITVRAPDPNEVSFFNLPPDGRVAVFEIFRIAFDQTGAPMRLTVTIYPTDRNQFVVDVGQVPDDPVA